MLPSRKQAVFPTLLCLLVGGSLLYGACSLASENPPLADSTFSRVLVDLHLLSVRKKQPTPLPPRLSDSLLRHHDVQRKEFDATLRYHARHPDDFASLYDGVLDTLKAISNRRYEPSTSPGVPDSLREQMEEARNRRP